MKVYKINCSFSQKCVFMLLLFFFFPSYMSSKQRLYGVAYFPQLTQLVSAYLILDPLKGWERKGSKGKEMGTTLTNSWP